MQHLLSEHVQEVRRVDSPLFGEAGLEPVLLHGHGLRGLTHQIPELLRTQVRIFF